MTVPICIIYDMMNMVKHTRRMFYAPHRCCIGSHSRKRRSIDTGYVSLLRVVLESCHNFCRCFDSCQYQSCLDHTFSPPRLELLWRRLPHTSCTCIGRVNLSWCTLDRTLISRYYQIDRLILLHRHHHIFF